MTLHLSHMGLTLGLTFTAGSILFCLLVGGVVDCRYLYRYTMRPRDRS